MAALRLRRRMIKVWSVIGVLSFITAPVVMAACLNVRVPEIGNPPPEAKCYSPAQTVWKMYVPIEYQTDDESAELKWYWYDLSLQEPPGESCDDVTGWIQFETEDNLQLGCSSWNSSEKEKNLEQAAFKTYCWKVEIVKSGGSAERHGEVTCPDSGS
jgi:hypothetical protein